MPSELGLSPSPPRGGSSSQGTEVRGGLSQLPSLSRLQLSCSRAGAVPSALTCCLVVLRSP